MTGGEKEICLVLANNNLFTQVRDQLRNHFTLENVPDIEKTASKIRQRNVLCLIAGVDDTPETTLQQLSLFIKQFPTIPIITIVDGNNFDLILSCGKIGVNEVLINTELDKIKENIFMALNRRQLWRLHKLGLDTTNCSERVKRALEIIESRCNKIKFVRILPLN